MAQLQAAAPQSSFQASGGQRTANTPYANIYGTGPLVRSPDTDYWTMREYGVRNDPYNSSSIPNSFLSQVRMQSQLEALANEQTQAIKRAQAPAGGGYPVAMPSGGGIPGAASGGGAVTYMPGGVPAAPGFDQEIAALLKGLIGDYSKGNARAESEAGVRAQAEIEREKNMPILRRAVEGAGTSAGSMQALLAQNFERDIARSAAMAGNDAATKYGTIQASLSSALSNLATGNQSNATDLLRTILTNQSQENVAGKKNPNSGFLL